MILHKYQALGNDFLIFDCINYYENEVFLKEANFLDFIIKKSNRRRIGCDQFIVMEKSQNADCKIVFYNADGSRAEACGNGTVASGVYASKFLNKNNIKIETDTQIVDVKINGNEATIELDMPRDLGLSGGDSGIMSVLNRFFYGDQIQFINHISVGNPHCVIALKDKYLSINMFIERYSQAGKEIENLTHIFPNRTNVEFVTQIDENKFDCFVWERGVGRTFACGTGACAVAFACVKNGLADSTKPIEIFMKGSYEYADKVSMKVFFKEKAIEFTNSAFFEGEIHC